MPWPYEASVVHRQGCDYWRTCFLEECEKSQLFGITEKHLDLIRLSGPDCPAYRVGTRLFLEDAPYFRASKIDHRVCGPYEVYSAPLPDGASPIYKDSGGNVIVYKDAHPELGPWFDRSSVNRVTDGIRLHFPQIAGEFGFYPYRFGIRRSSRFTVELVRHETGC
jgi:hypothetical protein